MQPPESLTHEKQIVILLPSHVDAAADREKVQSLRQAKSINVTDTTVFLSQWTLKTAQQMAD